MVVSWGEFLVLYISNSIMVFGVLANKILGTIKEVRMSEIGSLLATTERFINTYNSPGIKCKAPIQLPVSRTSIEECLECDAQILGALLWHRNVIRNTSGTDGDPPYKHLSVYNLANQMKTHDDRLDPNLEHEDCLIREQVAIEVDEVLGRIERLDIWDRTHGAPC